VGTVLERQFQIKVKSEVVSGTVSGRDLFCFIGVLETRAPLEPPFWLLPRLLLSNEPFKDYAE